MADSATCSVVRAVVYTCTMVPWHVMLTGFNRRIQSFENRCLCSGASCQGLMRLPVACKPLTASATRLSVLRQWPECYRFGMLTYRILAVIHLYKKKGAKTNSVSLRFNFFRESAVSMSMQGQFPSQLLLYDKVSFCVVLGFMPWPSWR